MLVFVPYTIPATFSVASTDSSAGTHTHPVQLMGVAKAIVDRELLQLVVKVLFTWPCQDLWRDGQIGLEWMQTPLLGVESRIIHHVCPR